MATFAPAQVIDLRKLDAFPPAARQREITKAYNTFVGNPQHLFTHHVKPVLDLRRRELAFQDTGRKSKKFYKWAGQRWARLGDREQKPFWHFQCEQLRRRIKQGHLSEQQVLVEAGESSEWAAYQRYAEMAVAEYLGIPLPESMQEEEVVTKDEKDTVEPASDVKLLETTPEKDIASERAGLETDIILTQPQFENTNPIEHEQHLLDTLPEPFSVEARMLYGNFAHAYPYTQILTAEGERQISLLRQLADWFDSQGKVLFYYYVYPHLWKTIRPTDVDETIASAAHRIWQFMEGKKKEEWRRESAATKKVLGDGKVEGLERLMVESLDPDVLRVHEMTVRAIENDKERGKG